jgi:DNA-binding CsgD family transcriptional regulator
MLDSFPSVPTLHTRPPHHDAAARAMAGAHNRALAFHAAPGRPFDEAPAAPGPMADLMAGLLDAIDYGLLLLGADGTLLHANRQAEAELDGLHPLQRRGRQLCARRAADQSCLQAALAGALRGLRRLVTLGEPGCRASVSVVPLDPGAPAEAPKILLLLGKRHLCEPLSVQWFARAHGLTPAETRVLEALCAGGDAREIADRHGVGIATVRTQIGAIRAKTGAESIRDLVHMVAALPPMMSALRAA